MADEHGGSRFRLPWTGPVQRVARRETVASPVRLARTRAFAPGGLRGDASRCWTVGDRGAARLPAGRAARRHAGARRPSAAPDDQAAGQARRDRRPQRAASSPTASTPTRSPPIRPTSTIPTRCRACVCAALDGCNGAAAAADGRAAPRRRGSSPIWRGRSRPRRRSRVKALRSARRASSSRRAAATTRRRSSPRTCSATSASTTSASPASSRRSTAQIRGQRRQDPPADRRAGGMRCRGARSGRRPPATSLELTIDKYLQYIADRELRIGVEENKAAGGTAIIMKPQTGEILALANWPTFNPNDFSAADADVARGTAPSRTLYEPGSTFKVVTASAAIEEGLIRTTDLDRLQPRLHHLRRRARSTTRTTTDSCRSSTSSPSRATSARSRSASGSAPSGWALHQPVRLRPGARRRTSAARAPASSGTRRGSIRARSRRCRWATRSASRRCRWRRGQRRRQRRRAARAARRPRVHPERAPRGSPAQGGAPRDHAGNGGDADRDHGSGGRARHRQEAAPMEGFTVAGKTGTASKLVNGRYSKSDYNASFVGFVPSRKPALTIVVVIDSPHAKGYYGAAVSAPVFKRIAEAALRHLGVGPTINAAAAGAGRATRSDDGRRRAAAGEGRGAGRRRTPTSSQPTGMMPDLRGLSAREALRTLTRIGLTARMSGDGFVVEQRPRRAACSCRGNECVLEARSARVRAGRSEYAMNLARLLRDAPTGCTARRQARTARAADAQPDLGAAASSDVVARRRRLAAGRAGLRVRRAARRPRRRRVVRAATRSRAARSRSCRKRPAPADVARALDSGRRRAAGAGRARGGVRRHPERGADARRHHRHERQDDDLVPARLDLRGRRRALRPHRHASATASASARSKRARTTPEAPELQRMLREMVTEGCGACVMEVSSHALALRRADQLHFAAAIFTNLTRDHLDFHGDME